MNDLWHRTSAGTVAKSIWRRPDLAEDMVIEKPGGHGRHARPVVSVILPRAQPAQPKTQAAPPYDETFLLLEGHVLVRAGDDTVEGGPGDLVIRSPGISSWLYQLGPGLARLACIHAARHANHVPQWYETRRH